MLKRYIVEGKCKNIKIKNYKIIENIRTRSKGEKTKECCDVGVRSCSTENVCVREGVAKFVSVQEVRQRELCRYLGKAKRERNAVWQ
jgi:hypothetical protein